MFLKLNLTIDIAWWHMAKGQMKLGIMKSMKPVKRPNSKF